MNDIPTLLQNPDRMIEMAITYGGQLFLALVTLLVGLWLIGKLVKILKRIFEMRSFEQTLQSFLIHLITITLKVLLIISTVTMVGVQMTSFIAILGAAGLAFGLALSGTLQNFAGGVMLLMYKPFKVGDYIDAQGTAGSVIEIQIFHTILKTPDNKTIVIPNGGLSNSTLTNYSTEPVRRVDWIFNISYSDNIDNAREIILSVIHADDRIHKDPVPFVGVISLGDSSVNLVTRVWVDTLSYWDVFFLINENVKKAFDKTGISIPFPQRDVHIIQTKIN